MRADDDWLACLARIDELFAEVSRPEHFTKHEHCCECSDADEFFKAHTPTSMAAFMDPPETLPFAFLTDAAFRYFLPAFIRMMGRDGKDYCAGDILFLLENRMDLFETVERSAIRDALYVIYDRQHAQIHASFFDYEAFWRVLNKLDRGAT